MKIEYDREANALYVYFREVEVAKSKEVEEGVVVDLDAQGHIVGIEILDVSHRLTTQELVNVNIQNIPVEIN